LALLPLGVAGDFGVGRLLPAAALDAPARLRPVLLVLLLLVA
jgi:hypothetical protein